MPLWKDTDAAANTPIYTPMQVDLPANSANRDAMFGNTTANSFIVGEKVGTFGVSQGEMRAARKASSVERPAHSGYTLRREGTGNRSGRIHHEVLVAMGSLTGDGENTLFPEYTLFFTTNPSDASKSSSNNETATFTVNGNSTPLGATLAYFWQKWNAANSIFQNVAASGAYSNVTTATLSVLANTAANGEIYRCGLSSANGGAISVYSGNAVFTKLT